MYVRKPGARIRIHKEGERTHGENNIKCLDATRWVCDEKVRTQRRAGGVFFLGRWVGAKREARDLFVIGNASFLLKSLVSGYASQSFRLGDAQKAFECF